MSGATFDDFIRALHLVENGGCADGSCPTGDAGKSIGPLQIQLAYHADAMEMLQPEHQYPYERNEEIEFAKRTVKLYLTRYGAKALMGRDWFTCAQIHNGGPSGATKQATVPHARKVVEKLAEIERARGSGQTSGPVVSQDSNPAAAPRVVASEAVVPKKVERGLIVEKPVEVVAAPAPSKLQSRSLWVTILGAAALIIPPIIQAMSIPPDQAAEIQKALAEGDWIRAVSVAIVIGAYLFANAFKAWARARVLAP